MPSFRVALLVGAVDPGVDPASLVGRAAAAAAEFTTVEASDIAVVAGRPRIVVRFTEDDADVALQLGEHVASTVATVARVAGFTVTRRERNRWLPVR